MRRDKETLEPMTLNTEEVCQLLGISSSSFYEKQKMLRDLGFPARHPALGRYSREAVEDWLRKTSGLAGPADEESFEI